MTPSTCSSQKTGGQHEGEHTWVQHVQGEHYQRNVSRVFVIMSGQDGNPESSSVHERKSKFLGLFLSTRVWFIWLFTHHTTIKFCYLSFVRTILDLFVEKCKCRNLVGDILNSIRLWNLDVQRTWVYSHSLQINPNPRTNVLQNELQDTLDITLSNALQLTCQLCLHELNTSLLKKS